MARKTTHFRPQANMPSIKPPLLMIGMYRQGSPPHAVLSQTLDCLFQRNIQPFSVTYYDNNLAENLLNLNGLADAKEWLRDLDPGVKLEFELQGETKGAKAFFRLGNAESVLIKSPGNCVTLYSDGSAFTTGGRNPFEVGKSTYEIFLQICSFVKPTYASITVEWALEEPEELLKDPRSLAFRDFYLSDELSSNLLTVATSMYADSFIETLPSGRYISCTEWFNPKRINNPLGASRLMSTMAKLLANSLT